MRESTAVLAGIMGSESEERTRGGGQQGWINKDIRVMSIMAVIMHANGRSGMGWKGTVGSTMMARRIMAVIRKEWDGDGRGQLCHLTPSQFWRET